MVTQNYNIEQEILFVDNSGRLDFESMKKYFSSLKDYSYKASVLYIIEDARKANVKFNSEHLLSLSKVLQKVSEKYEYVYHAVLLEERKNIAYAMMINQGIGVENYTLDVFSDESIALEWIRTQRYYYNEKTNNF